MAPASTSLAAPMTSSNQHSHDMWYTPPSSPGYGDRSYAPRERSGSASMSSTAHWGHIAIFYLVEQMARWERFVFRYDKQFSSVDALKTITGDAPLLKEFEISSGEGGYYPEWRWLPTMSSAPSSPPVSTIPNLESLTLQLIPFKWSSPIFHGNLHTLTLRSLLGTHTPLDRVLHILRANKDTLRFVRLSFPDLTANILPLSPLTLPELQELSLDGHSYLNQLMDTLTLPSLEELNLDVECRDSGEDTVIGLIARSGGPALMLKHLAIGFGFGCGRGASLLCNISPTSTHVFYGPGCMVLSWSVLRELPHLESLRVGGHDMNVLFGILGVPDEDTLIMANPQANTTLNWLCPNLTELRLRQGHAHSDGMSKLVQMIEARNPSGATGPVVINGMAPKKITLLELFECANVGYDVVEWLEGQVREVVFTEAPVLERRASVPY